MIRPDKNPVPVHMNPNTAHQMWSKWTFTVTPPPAKAKSLFGSMGNVRKYTFEEVQINVTRFVKKAFGTATQMKVEEKFHLIHKRTSYVVTIRTEGHPVHDPGFMQSMKRDFTVFFQSGFGMNTHVEIEAKLEAGDRQDGKPPDQLIIMPSMSTIGEENK